VACRRPRAAAGLRGGNRENHMYRTLSCLDDEHMQLYEWSGAGAGITLAGVAKAPRAPRAWHALCGVMVLLTALLAL